MTRANGRFAIVLVVIIVAGSFALPVATGRQHQANQPGGGAPAASSINAPVARAGASPNIVLILTDDQRYDQLSQMPFIQRHLVDRGRRLQRYFVVNPLCCPSRATMLTGLYSHSTGIYLNGDGPAGGFKDFRDRSTVAVWLDQAGYRTGLFGKYLNHYEDGSYVPPGWDTWRALVGSNSQYYDYDLSFNGTMHHFGSTPADYSTDVYGRLAASFVRTTPTDKPLFMYVAPPAPHGPTTPPPRYEDALSKARMPRYPDFNESDVSDKPAWLRQMTPLSSFQIGAMQARWLSAARTLLAVDDAVADVVKALHETGRLRNTLIVFTSDNGLSYGEHRLMGKLNPYEESIRVPMVVRWDGHVPAGTTSMHLAGNVDLAATFAAVGHATHPAIEGVSLVSLITRDQMVRRAILIEHQHGGYPQDPPTNCEIRTARWVLIRLASGPTELYDLRRDPYELRNAAGIRALASTRHRLMSRLRTLCDPRPPGMPGF